ncbi:MAG: hypothetical protein NZ805_09815 [Armatimonadetes bacterium]|nr:hypothetical protein [Armatimonadota bacterium]MDW8028932.1 hypothetical protein [Armatimonadota bacterium]
MLYKEDWEQAKGRFMAWWQGEVVDRVALQVRAPRKVYQPKKLNPPAKLEDRWTDIEWRLNEADENFRATFFGGEAFPCFWCNLGPDLMAAFLGAELVFEETTIWVKPIIDDWETAPPLHIDPENRWWRLTLEMTKAAVEFGKDKFFVGLTDIHAGGDLLAALRGRENFCLDLVEHPEKVCEAMKQITPLFFEVYESLHSIIRTQYEGTCTWLNVWAQGRWYPVSMDELALISPKMFRKFFLNDIVAQVNWLDNSLFHLDGPDCVRHLDILLEIPNLNGIQWVPGARYKSMLVWVPLLRKIQQAGKLIHIAVPANEIEILLSELSPKGLMLDTYCASEDEAKDLLRKATKWTKEKVQVSISEGEATGDGQSQPQ